MSSEWDKQRIEDGIWDVVISRMKFVLGVYATETGVKTFDDLDRAAAWVACHRPGLNNVLRDYNIDLKTAIRATIEYLQDQNQLEDE